MECALFTFLVIQKGFFQFLKNGDKNGKFMLIFKCAIKVNGGFL